MEQADLRSETDDGGVPRREENSLDGAGDKTIIEDEVGAVLGTGGDEEFNLASTRSLKKNLTETFDKHANTDCKAASVSTTGGVKSKIAQLEMKSNKKANSGRVLFKNDGGGKRASLAPKHPPRIPIPGPKDNAKRNSLLSVYLRIRPPVAGTDSELDGANTVEILDPKKENGGRITMIRSYPPQDSNAAKVVRSQHHLHANSSSNTDQVFGDGTEEGKGVKEYEFSEVFGPTASQADLYEGVAAPLVKGLFPRSEPGQGDNGEGKLVGQSALLFAYGITNAGKTYTIMGGSEGPVRDLQESSRTDPHPNRGVIPRILHDILQRIKEENQDYHLNMSYFEIYNEQVYDLLGDSGKSSLASESSGTSSHRRPSHLFGPMPLKLRESRNGKIIVRGLAKHRVTSVSHALELANMAKKKRHTSSNNINSDSSRSHCVCQLELAARPCSNEEPHPAEETMSETSDYNTDDEEAPVKKNECRSVAMWIVDLAGSERSKRTGTMNKSARQKEAALINSSLMKLMRCLQTLRNNQLLPKAGIASSAMVPFRESKLTHLFMYHLTGAAASRTSMIVNINPCVADYDETQHILSCATVARNVIISETDYNRKWRAIATTCTEHTHGNDGRPLKGTKPKSPPRKIVRLAKRISPRSMLAKRRELQEAKTHKRKAELQSMRGATSLAAVGGSNKRLKGASSNANGKQSKGKHRSNYQHNGGIQQLRKDLTASREEVAKLQSECLALKEQLSQREDEIRMEVAEDVEQQMKAMREQYNSVVDRLKMQIKSQPTPGKSTKKAQLDQAEQYIEELMDKVDECEEEMVRMRDLHNEEVANLRKIQEEAKKAEIASLKELHEEALRLKEEELAEVKDELEACQEENEELNQLLKDDTEEQSNSSSDENDEENSLTPQVRRLRRERCSEVACSNVSSPNKEAQPSSKKKRGIGMLRSKVASSEKKTKEPRHPLCPIPQSSAENVPHQSSTESNYDGDEEDHEIM